MHPLFALLLLLAPALDSGVILFSDNFNQGSFTQWKLGINNPGDPARDTPRSRWSSLDRVKIVPAPLAALPGDQAVQFTVPHTPGDFRSELALASEAGYHERWYAARIFVPADWIFDPTPGSDIVMQWHAVLGKAKETPGQRNFPPLSVAIRNDRWVVTNNYGALSDIQRKTFDITGRVERGRWTTWVVHVRWSPASDGLLELWKDGQPVVRKVGQNTYITGNAHSPYFKIGIYHPTWNPAHAAKTAGADATIASKVIVIDDVMVGNEKARYADVAPHDVARP